MKKPDILPGYFNEDIDLQSDPYGKNPIATLVSKPCDVPSKKAVLYLHGYCDYFFNEEFGSHFIDQGFNFYALDLRRYGRSIRKDDIPFMIDAISTYFEEIDCTLTIIKKRDENTVLILYGHSTGGLTVPLYAQKKKENPPYDAIILNSPFWDFKINAFERHVLLPGIVKIAKTCPLTVFPQKKVQAELYGKSLHKDYEGEWSFNCDLKPVMNQFPYYFGWIQAIYNAHGELKKGLAIKKPVLVMTSARSGGGLKYNSDYTNSDCVLDVTHMEKLSPLLGDSVEVVKFENGLHDLVLSQNDVRQKVYEKMFDWLKKVI